jgi:hypothetical protein
MFFCEITDVSRGRTFRCGTKKNSVTVRSVREGQNNVLSTCKLHALKVLPTSPILLLKNLNLHIIVITRKLRKFSVITNG